MKASRLRWFLLFLLVSAVLQLPAQQSEADRKLLADLRAKAEKGDALFQWVLGGVFEFGLFGVGQDNGEAVSWYCRAAGQGFAPAEYSLGVRCRRGYGGYHDDVGAVKLYRLAAEQNHKYAQCSLGLCYEDGRGVPKNELEAVKWLRKAAEQNVVYAQYRLGVRYDDGQGVAQDDLEAVKWYRKAAQQNHAGAQYNLSLHYCNGKGVAKDNVEAFKWMLLAWRNGHQTSWQMMGVMTPEQIAEGQRLARAFTPREMPSMWSDSYAERMAQPRQEATGTGFFITEDGYLITNEHVAGNGAQVRLVTEAGLISAKVVKVDAANDLALLKMEGKFTPLPVVSSRTIKIGGVVATVGFPDIGLQGFAPKLAKGEIAALSGAQDDPRYFQIIVPVQPGNSGGALVDERGNVVAVVAAKLNVAAALATSGALPENVNYAVKSSLLLSFLESVPQVAAKLKEPNTKDRKFEDVVQSAEKAAVLVLVY